MNQKREEDAVEAALADLSVSSKQTATTESIVDQSAKAAAALAFADKYADDGLRVIKIRIPADLDEEQLLSRLVSFRFERAQFPRYRAFQRL